MYLSYFQLEKKPFHTSSDPDFLWLGEKHQEALSSLNYGVQDNRGFLLLCGEAGTGKTTLVNAFVNSLGDDVIVAHISNPSHTRLGLLKYIAEMFGIKTTFERKDEFLSIFTTFLNQAYTDNKKVLLIIDEAQLLTHEPLEEIRLLSNIEKQCDKLLNILFVGQSEFKDTLEKHENRAIRQRITTTCTLDAFEKDETRSCIEYRLQVAGASTKIFSCQALDAIHQISEGIPRLINILCDNILLRACLQGVQEISGEKVWSCANDLHLIDMAEVTNMVDMAEKSIGEDGETSHHDLLEESDIPALNAETLQDLLKKSNFSQPGNSGFAEVAQQQQKTKKGRWSLSFSHISALLLALLLALHTFLGKTNPISSFLQKDLSAALVTPSPKPSPTTSMLKKLSRASSPASTGENQTDFEEENSQVPFRKLTRESQKEGTAVHPPPASKLEAPEYKEPPPSVNNEKTNKTLHKSTAMRFEPISMSYKDPSAAIDGLSAP